MAKVRTRLVLALVIAGMGAGGAWWVMTDYAQHRIAELEREQAQMQLELESFEAMIDRLGRSRRLGQIDVLDQVTDDATGKVMSTTVRFLELNDNGRSIGEQEVMLPGDVIHVDTQTIRFPVDDVAAGHPLRGSTLVLLRRLYSERVAPEDGVLLDVPGAVPPGYAASDGGHGAWERGLWASFWRLASDPVFASSAGVRVAQGEVVYQQMKPGQSWRLDVDSVGGITLLAASP